MATSPRLAANDRLVLTRLASPLGELRLLTQEDGAVVALAFPGDGALESWAAGAPVVEASKKEPRSLEAGQQLAEYFAGKRRSFDVTLEPRIGTDFQRRVWRALAKIPFGQTWSYARLATEVGSVPRAVGGANGANPIAILWPCHRVIGADGSLTGYAGGVERKEWLLKHEGAWPEGRQAQWF